MPATNSIVKRYTLTGGENTYSSPAAINESDARKLQSLIPSLSGALERERPTVPFTADAPFPSRIGFFHQFKRNNNGIIVTYQFCATATQLYQLTGAFPTFTWQPVAAIQIQNFPVAANINNTMHITDNVNSWIYDGITWVTDGLPIPVVAPRFAIIAPVGIVIAAAPTGAVRVNGMVTITTSTPHGLFIGQVAVIATTDATFNGIVTVLTIPTPTTFTYKTLSPYPDATSGGGTLNGSGITILSNRYYWTTYSDQSLTHPHESSSSPISLGTGPQTNQQFQVFAMPGTVTTNNTTPNVVGVATSFDQRDVGKFLYAAANQYIGTVQSVQDPQHLTLAANSLWTTAASPYNLGPPRATYWNLYASSSEEDKIGNYLASIPINQFYYLDFSPMIGTAGSYFRSVQRPLLNDPPLPSPILEVFANRLWRTVPKFPNFFSYTGNEEILAEQAGTPSECVPGDDPNTVSPGQINETSYPDQSSTITGMKAHGAAMFIGTELNVIPLYGDSLSNFQLSNSQAFAVGFAGRRLCISTPFGLAFVSYDTKVYLYPSQYSFGVDSTTALVELGRPKRPEFEKIDGSDYQNASLTFYNWGRRNWLVLHYRRVDQTFATWVFDFETKGWFQMQQGYTAITVFEMTLGRRSLIAATTSNKIVVIDDLTGNYPISGGTIYPPGYFRTLLDFGDPNAVFVVHSVEYEKSDLAMEVDVTVWLDPVDPDNPGTGIPLPMTNTAIGANTFKGRLNADSGATCQRILVEYAIAAGPIAGRFHGFTVEAEKTPDPVL